MNGVVRILLALSVLPLAACSRPAPETSRPNAPAFMTGVDANYSRDMASKGAVWKTGGADADLFRTLHASGVDSLRVRIWTGDTGPSGRDYACALAKRAQEAGLEPYLVLFLSENWADYVKQPAPTAWAKLPFEDKLRAVTSYCEATTRHFQRAGIETDLYEIGNEIDFGICGEFEEKWENRFNYAHMKSRIWNKAARVIGAAQDGVRRADPEARFVLHLTQWWNPGFCGEFLEAMSRGGAHVDLLGLSFFASSRLCEENTFAQLADSVQSIKKRTGLRVLICECAYPSVPSFGGQFASWNRPVDGYPLTEAGQEKWLRDFLAFCRGRSDIAGAFYWSPEWCTAEMWQAFALFHPDGEAKAGLTAFGVR